MDASITGIESAMKMALNIVPTEHKDIGITDDQAKELISSVIANIQGKLIAYQCLQAAVKMEKSKRTRERIENTFKMLLSVAIKENTV